MAVRGLLYLVAFVAARWVPRTVDGGGAAAVTGGGAAAVAVDVALFAAFALPHSLMARPGFKRWLAARGLPPALERSLYCLLAGALLALLFWQWRPLPWTVWHLEAEAARWAVTAVGAAGWLFAAGAVLTLRNTRLFGLSQGWRWARGRPAEAPALVTRGPYAMVRHPVYLGFLVGCWAAPTMSAGRLLLAALSTLYVSVAWRWEERGLVRRFGPAYERYRTRVGAFVPRRARG